MPMNHINIDMNTQYFLAVTHKCNWFCDYCIVDTHNAPFISTNDVLREIDRYEENSDVSISGGEPGSISKNAWRLILAKLKEKKCNLDLLTNGLMFKNHPEIIGEFNEILYHCSEDLLSKIEYENLPSKVIYVLVIKEDDIAAGRVKDMMNRYSDIKFLLSLDMRKGKMAGFAKYWKFVNDNIDLLHERNKEEMIKNTII